MGVYTCEASNDMGKMFAVLNIPENNDLPLVDEGEEEEEKVVTRNKQELKSGSVVNGSDPMVFILVAVTVLLRIRA